MKKFVVEDENKNRYGNRYNQTELPYHEAETLARKINTTERKNVTVKCV